MEKLIVVANFVCEENCEDELYSSQWLVGIFNTIDECMSASLEDLYKVAHDHFECVVPEEEFEEDEYDKVLVDKIKDYISDHWKREANKIIDDLTLEGSSEILSNDFIDGEHTDQRHIIKYYIHKINT